MRRRRFILKAGGALAVAGAAAVIEAPHVIAQPKVQWRLSTSWPPVLDHLNGAAERLAKVVDEISGGRFRIEVFPGGRIMPPLECFTAASQGTIEAFMASASYWAAHEPALEWFTTIPFGMNPEGMAAWYHQGDGLKLWEEAYTAFNLVPRQSTTYAPQMAGWLSDAVTRASSSSSRLDRRSRRRLSMSLMATRRRSSSSCARYTTPMPPAPSSASMR